MDNVIDRSGFISHFLHQIFYSLALYHEKWPKMAIFIRRGGEDAYTLMYFDRHINGNKDGKILESNK